MTDVPWASIGLKREKKVTQKEFFLALRVKVKESHDSLDPLPGAISRLITIFHWGKDGRLNGPFGEEGGGRRAPPWKEWKRKIGLMMIL